MSRCACSAFPKCATTSARGRNGATAPTFRWRCLRKNNSCFTTKDPARRSRNQTRNISRKARKDRQVKKSNFLGARGWVAFACLAHLAREESCFLNRQNQ